MSKIIIHNRSKRLSDAEACHFASRFLDLYRMQGHYVNRLWMSIFGKKVYVSTGENEQSDRIIIEDNRQEELRLPIVKKIDKSQTNSEIQE